MGFSVPLPLLAARWALTPPFHPYRRIAEPAVCFQWHSPSTQPHDCLARVYPGIESGLRGIAPSSVRTFLPVLADRAILHPSKITDILRPILLFTRAAA